MVDGSLISNIITSLIKNYETGETSIFTKEEYGVLAIVTIITTISNHVISLASKTSILRLIYDYEKKDDKDKIVFVSVLLSFVTSLIILVLLFIFQLFAMKFSLNINNYIQ